MTLISLDAGEKLAGLEKVVETEDDSDNAQDDSEGSEGVPDDISQPGAPAAGTGDAGGEA